jgi:methyl-accepting chemotaxis protein
MTRDQRQLREILMLAEEARDAAYSLFSRRLDTQRNVDSFILLRDAFNLMRRSCETLNAAIDKATETRSSDQNDVATEIMVRSGRARVIIEDERPAPRKPGTVVPFPPKKG